MQESQQTLAIIGVGAFGTFMVQHLAPYFKVLLCDDHQPELDIIAQQNNAQIVTLEETITADIIVLAVPVPVMATVAKELTKYLTSEHKPLVIQVGSVQVKPMRALLNILPKHVSVLGVHPLFGPQSAANGLADHNTAIIEGRGDHVTCVQKFLTDLKLNTFVCTADEHDKQMAYAQALTHMVGKVFTAMNIPELFLTTKTYDLLAEVMAMVQDDSDDLFKTIQTDNPHVHATKAQFFAAVQQLETDLKEHDNQA